jgi:hypothetical protein
VVGDALLHYVGIGATVPPCIWGSLQNVGVPFRMHCYAPSSCSDVECFTAAPLLHIPQACHLHINLYAYYATRPCNCTTLGPNLQVAPAHAQAARSICWLCQLTHSRRSHTPVYGPQHELITGQHDTTGAGGGRN